MLAYTSGTTGAPKGVPLTHGNVLASIRGVMLAWRWSADDVLVHALPLSHQHGLSGVHLSLLAGSRAVMLGRFDPAALCETIAASARTVLFAVPAMYERLVAWEGIDAADLSSLRLLVSGRRRCRPRWPSACARGSRAHALERYGSTETGLDVSNAYDGPRRPGRVGLALPGIEMRVRTGGARWATARTGRSWSAARRSSRATGAARRRRPRRSPPAAGSARATSAASIPTTAASRSPAAARS